MKNISLLFLILASNFSFAQMTYKEVDSTSYALYHKHDWNSLIRFGEKAANEGNDFFYFNLRVGIAYFNFQEYKQSKLFLEKANANNSYDKVTIEYLFWANYYLLKEKEALKWYKQLDDTIQQRIDYSPENFISSIYVEGGQKFSTDKEIANKLDYFNFALKLHLSGKINLEQGYTFLQQKMNWGDFKQHQYYLNPTFNFNQTLSFNLGFHYANYHSNLDYYSRDSYRSPPPMGFPGGTFLDSTIESSYEIQGSYQENDFFFQPRLTKSWDKFSLSPFVSYTMSQQNASYKEHFIDTTVITERIGPTIINQTTEYTDSISQPGKTTIHQFGIGTGLYLNLKRLTLGSEFEYINKDNKSYFFFSPFVKYSISEKLKLSSYFFQKKNYTVGLFQASQLLNSTDKTTKFSLTTQYELKRNLKLYFTYQFENTTDRLSTDKYKLNSFYIGVKLKF